MNPYGAMRMMMKVPFLDLKVQYRTLRTEIDEAIGQVFEQAAFSGGTFVAGFEKEFASFCGSPYAIGVGSGTEALWLALCALGVNPGDEIITVPNSFIATAEAISLCGARPVFVDVEESTYNMDPTLLESAITPRTKAVIPVHLFGQTADMDPILKIAARHGLFIIEDACQAHGAEYKGIKAGSMGEAGCFSFYPGKNLGAYGEAGMVVTKDPALAEKVRMIRDHGQSQKYHHHRIGWNARMDGIQGAVLNVKLKRLTQWNEARRRNAHRYHALLGDIPDLAIPHEAPYGRHVYHIYAIRVRNRDRLIALLAEGGIACGIHYPVPIHLQQAYGFLNLQEGSFPVAERCAKEFVSLPMFPELSDKQVEYVSQRVKQNLCHQENVE
jgi:dTDP-4-amino-4,6-dideoxygalactose transaminase